MSLIGMSLTHNDFNKGWLGKWLNRGLEIFDKWVILDDGSLDDTVSYIQQLNTDKIILISNKEETFKLNENKIRSQLWNEVRKIAKDGDWIMTLDSDEIPCIEFEAKTNKIMEDNCRGLVYFKKIEMWNDKEYRIDGLWSNFFDRMFHFEDKDWGYDAEGFHHPQVPSYVIHSDNIIRSNCRIQHLAYSTKELRDAKYNFMMNNSQQKKDITYHHLQSVADKNPQLKEFKEEIQPDKILLAFFISNNYRISPQFINNLQNINKETEIMFFIGNSSKLTLDVLETSDFDNLSELRLMVYNEKLDSYRLYMKNSFFRLIEKKYQNYDYIVLADYDDYFDKDILEEIIILEKDVGIDRMTNKLVVFKKGAFTNFINLFKIINPTIHENKQYVDIMSKNHYIWGLGLFAPFPFNIGGF